MAAPSRPKIACRFHAGGACANGAACPFSHEALADPTPSSGTAASTSLPNTTTNTCRFFAIGKCANGPSCLFAHDDAPRSAPAAGPPPPKADSRSQKPCFFFANGGCKNGHACPFAHSRSADAEPAVADSIEATTAFHVSCFVSRQMSH